MTYAPEELEREIFACNILEYQQAEGWSDQYLANVTGCSAIILRSWAKDEGPPYNQEVVGQTALWLEITEEDLTEDYGDGHRAAGIRAAIERVKQRRAKQGGDVDDGVVE